MHILVTGGAGYIGSMLVPALVKEEYKVSVVDNLTFGNNLNGKTGFTLYVRDCLDIDPHWLEGVDIVIHLAGLSNDPMANFRPRDNFIDNTALTSLLIYLCKQKGVKRFIFGSTCSVYGLSKSHREDDEDSPVYPSFPYGISKMQAEYALNSARDENFKPIILRQATVYGWAPRMRFDLMVNTMVKYGVCEKKIIVNSPNLWRPLVHIRDLVRAYLDILKLPGDLTGTFNIVSRNYTVLEVAQQVRRALAENGHPCEIEVLSEPDPRSYRLDGTRARKILGFAPKLEIGDGVEEILRKVGDARALAWHNPWFINAEVYRKKVLGEEKAKEIWKDFLAKFKNEYDHLTFTEWPQEGP